MALCLLGIAARAQTQYPDLIVTANGDSVRCAFTSTEGETLRFYYKNEEGLPAKSWENKKGLRYFERNYYARREAGAGNPPRKSARPRSPTRWYSASRVGTATASPRPKATT